MSGYALFIWFGVAVTALLGLLFMGVHDNQIDWDDWNNRIKSNSIDLITNCDEFHSSDLGEKGFWVDRLYTTQQGKYFPQNKEMFDYIEVKKMELGC